MVSSRFDLSPMSAAVVASLKLTYSSDKWYAETIQNLPGSNPAGATLLPTLRHSIEPQSWLHD